MSLKSHHLCMKKNQSQDFAKPGFSGHRTQEHPWFPGRFCTRLSRVWSSQGLLQAGPAGKCSRGNICWTGTERAGRTEALHLVSSPDRRLAGRAAAVPPLEALTSPLHHASQDCDPARAALLGSSPHTDVRTLIKISRPPEYLMVGR